jgi:hypothetical protein
MTSRHFAQIKSDSVKRPMHSTMVSEIFQDTMYCANDTALSSDIPWRTRIAGVIFRCNDNGVTDFEFAMHWLCP